MTLYRYQNEFLAYFISYFSDVEISVSEHSPDNGESYLMCHIKLPSVTDAQLGRIPFPFEIISMSNYLCICVQVPQIIEE